LGGKFLGSNKLGRCKAVGSPYFGLAKAAVAIMRKYLAVLIVIVLFVAATAYFNRAGDEKENDLPDEKGAETVQDADLGGSNDVKLYPIDEAHENPEFEAFREKLMAVAKAKDVDFIGEHTDKAIRYTFGVNDRIEGFFRQWELDSNPGESMFWDELLQVLNLGGSFRNEEKTSFMAPYVYTEFPEDIDAFQHVAIIDKNVKVYAEPNTDAKVLGTLTYSIVKVLESRFKFEGANRQEPTWLKIESLSGNTGYIPAEYGRSPVDYRGNWLKSDGTWKMVFFVAGD
jgi:hypothetical protein